MFPWPGRCNNRSSRMSRLPPPSAPEFEKAVEKTAKEVEKRQIMLQVAACNLVKRYHLKKLDAFTRQQIGDEAWIRFAVPAPVSVPPEPEPLVVD